MLLEEINTQIDDLITQRNKLIEEKNSGYKDKILELSWIKDVDGFIFDIGMDAYASDKFILVGKLPHYINNYLIYGNPFALYGSDNDYKRNLMISRREKTDKSFEIYTSNPEILIEFIKKFKIKLSDGYGKNKLRIYKEIYETQGV